MIETAKVQPYVGPRPFTRGDQGRFFGREGEANDLLSVVAAHSVVLLYAQSGAGKTSLLNARLFPLLEGEGFEVLPVARLQEVDLAGLSMREVANPYVLCTLMCLAGEAADARRLNGTSVAGFLHERVRSADKDGTPMPRVIVFDQFEELFTVYPERWKDRDGFFRQLRDALDRDPYLRILFALREEYIAQFDRYASLLPGRARTRFRLERLTRDAALTAVTGPLHETGYSYAPGVAEELVRRLLEIQVRGPSREVILAEGEYVEPVQLQVVCNSIWENLSPQVMEIEEDHLRRFGDVEQALAEFYEGCIRTTAKQGGVPERRLREWFEKKLITSLGTRSTILREGATTGGMPNEVVDELERQYLIRAEDRAGARWYELSHDRFIGAIQQSNAEAAEASWRKRLQRGAVGSTLLATIVVAAALALAFRGVPRTSGVTVITAVKVITVTSRLPTYVWSGTWGSTGTGRGQFHDPEGLAVDRHGNMYVADLVNNRIQVLSPGGKVLHIWNGAGPNSPFSGPHGLALDRSGNLYVADQYNRRVVELSPAGQLRHTWGGVHSQLFGRPVGIAVDEHGSARNLYVGDSSGQRIVKISSKSGVVSWYGKQDVTSQGKRKRIQAFRAPSGLAVDRSGNVYVADYFADNVAKLSPKGELLLQFGAFGSQVGQFNQPAAALVDPQGNLIVADSNNNRVQAISPTGQATVLAGGRVGNGKGHFEHPAAVALDQQGNLYVADAQNDRVVKLSLVPPLP